jgi:Na+/proline symporter
VSRFPTRTLVLMILALLAFSWFWFRTHRNAEKPRMIVTPIVELPRIGSDGGRP